MRASVAGRALDTHSSVWSIDGVCVGCVVVCTCAGVGGEGGVECFSVGVRGLPGVF